MVRGQGVAAFLCGILVFQLLPSLPGVAWAASAPVAALLCLRWPLLRLPAWFCAGLCWALWHACSILGSGLPASLEGRDLRAEGLVAAPPESDGRSTRFDFDIERLWLGDEPMASPGRVRLSWYEGAPALAAGERWSLVLRMKQPHGFANPGGFDQEARLYRKRIRATGYVRPAGAQRLLDPGAHSLQRLRQSLGAGIAAALPGREMAGVVVALAIGDYQYIPRAQWEVFRNTGTTHLVAISGMHVAMVAMLCFLAVRWLWARAWDWSLRWPAPHAGAVAAIAGAFGYAALAGFSVPTQRALVMVAIAMAALLRGRGRALWRSFALALLCVLLYDPLAVMDAGFWLSFGAVAIILFGMGGRVGVPGQWSRRGWWWHWGRLHLLIAIGLAPPLLLLFQQLPLGSPLANVVAVPWFNLAVPVVLLGAALVHPLPALAAPLLGLAEGMIGLLWPGLEWIAGAGALQWTQHAPAGAALAAALCGVALALAPSGLPGRWLAVLFLLPALLAAPPRPAPGELWLTLLDVGQGLSAVLRTHAHTLVYDAGPRFSPDLDAGSAVVLPYLREQGLRSIDALLVSHADNDHAGGAGAVLGAIPVARVIASDPAALAAEQGAVSAETCVDGMSWQWDGVRFEILHPPPESAPAARLRNDASCVLRVEAGGTRVLLPGDIEARAEAQLLRGGRDVSAQVLVAPHHGSRSSSTPAFVRAVAPRQVLYATGYRNRWGFPDAQVVERYARIGAEARDSATHGAIEVRIPASGELAPPRAWRERHRRYWHWRGSG